MWKSFRAWDLAPKMPAGFLNDNKKHRPLKISSVLLLLSESVTPNFKAKVLPLKFHHFDTYLNLSCFTGKKFHVSHKVQTCADF